MFHKLCVTFSNPCRCPVDVIHPSTSLFHGCHSSWDRLLPNETNLALFKIRFLKMNRTLIFKKSQICPIGAKLAQLDAKSDSFFYDAIRPSRSVVTCNLTLRKIAI